MNGRRRYDALFDWAMKLSACGAVSYFIARAILMYLDDPSRITLLLAIISELATILILLASRRPLKKDWHVVAVAATLYAVAIYPLCLDVAPGIKLLSERIGLALQSAGFLWAIHAKLTLGRSFGLLPADRGIVRKGPYRFVRHPIYLGYLITHIGFLSVNFTPQNAVVLVALYAAQIYRIHREELTLSANNDYRRYREDVRYRLIYGLF